MALTASIVRQAISVLSSPAAHPDSDDQSRQFLAGIRASRAFKRYSRGAFNHLRWYCPSDVADTFRHS
jgi:hypothetical protein